MVNMIIDGKQISAEENITIMEAAERNGIPIPKLCYLKGINEIAACRVCVVELEGKEKLITSCNNVVKDGIVIYTGKLGSLKRFKDDVKEVVVGQDCGLNIESFNDIRVGDIVEGYEQVEVKRK